MSKDKQMTSNELLKKKVYDIYKRIKLDYKNEMDEKREYSIYVDDNKKRKRM